MLIDEEKKIFNSPVISLAFSPLSDILIAGSKSGELKLIDTHNWNVRGTGQYNTSEINAINFISHSKFYFSNKLGQIGYTEIEWKNFKFVDFI